MNPVSICTIDIKLDMISIESKVDNPGASSVEVVGNECYGVHLSLNNPGASSFKVVGNECYGVNLSLNEQDENSVISKKYGSGFGDSVNCRSTHANENKHKNGTDMMVHNPGAGSNDMEGYCVLSFPNKLDDMKLKPSADNQEPELDYVTIK